MHRLAVLSGVDREASACSEGWHQAKGLEADSNDMHASRHMATVLREQRLSRLLKLQSLEGRLKVRLESQKRPWLPPGVTRPVTIGVPGG